MRNVQACQQLARSERGEEHALRAPRQRSFGDRAQDDNAAAQCEQARRRVQLKAQHKVALRETEARAAREASSAEGAPILVAEGLGRRRVMAPFDLSLRAGEVLGLSGLLWIFRRCLSPPDTPPGPVKPVTMLLM